MQVFGQTTEYSVQLGSGLFSFRGDNAEKSTDFLLDFSQNNYTHPPGYFLNPFGRHSGFSYTANFQAQRVTKGHFIYGLQAGYESLSSRINITDISAIVNKSTPTNSNPYGVSGSKTILTSQYLILHPFLGRRMKIFKSISTDLTFGWDFAFRMNSKEKTTVHTADYDYYLKSNLDGPQLDNRLRMDLTNYYKKVGLTIGYSYGFTPYIAKLRWRLNSLKAYSQMIRLGLVFRL